MEVWRLMLRAAALEPETSLPWPKNVSVLRKQTVSKKREILFKGKVLK